MFAFSPADHSSRHRDSRESTTDVDPRYLHTITVHGREYQRHAVENAIQFLPVDEVLFSD